jgi:uncharacterized protein (DUF2147 family)
MLLPPPQEAREIARHELARLKDRTREELLRYETRSESAVIGRSGKAYIVTVASFLDSDDPESDLFVKVRVRPSGARLRRGARCGLVVDAESQLWDRGEVVGRLPSDQH